MLHAQILKTIGNHLIRVYGGTKPAFLVAGSIAIPPAVFMDLREKRLVEEEAPDRFRLSPAGLDLAARYAPLRVRTAG